MMIHKGTADAILKNRQRQSLRNRIAEEEEARRQAALPGGGGEKMDAGAVPENKMLPDPVEENKADEPEPEPPAFEAGLTGLESVTFASDRALQVAEDAGLTAESFEDAEPSGRTGFTTKDVRAIVEAGP